MKLYGYWRSTAAYRVRIALNLKGVTAEHVPVHLVRDGGEQNKPAYRALNPQGRVPSLVLADGTVLIQSSPIIEYLDEAYPEPPLLPPDPVARAKVRGAAAILGTDVHPLHNVAPLRELRGTLNASEGQVKAWIALWMTRGFEAFEELIGDDGYCFGREPGLADIMLIPQLYSARRFDVSLEGYPRILRVDALATEHPAFAQAHPSRQVDAE